MSEVYGTGSTAGTPAGATFSALTSYDGYGNQKAGPSLTPTSNPYGYDGYYTDAESGLFYLNARYYDPTTQRFTQEDTFQGDNMQMNLYGYCGGNPVNWTDPDGHEVKYISEFYSELKKLPILRLRASIAYKTSSGGRYCTISFMNGKYKHTFAMGGNSDMKMDRYAFYQAMGFDYSRMVKNVTVKSYWYWFVVIAMTVVTSMLTKNVQFKTAVSIGITSSVVSNRFLPIGQYQAIDTTLFIGGTGYYYTEELYRKGVDQRGNTNYQAVSITSKQPTPSMIIA